MREKRRKIGDKRETENGYNKGGKRRGKMK